MKRNTAKKILRHATKASDELNACLFDLSRTLEPQEFETYKKEIGNVMGLIFTQIVWPVLEEHKDLTPEQLRSD